METYEICKDLAIIIIFAKVFGLFARKLKAPQVVGEIIAGLILGPCVLGWVEATPFIQQMAEIGVILLMFCAGLETNLKELKTADFVNIETDILGRYVEKLLSANDNESAESCVSIDFLKENGFV